MLLRNQRASPAAKMGVPVDDDHLKQQEWGWEGEPPSLTQKQSAMLEATIDEVQASPLCSSVKIDAARSAVWRYLVAAQWRLEPVAGRRVSDFFIDTLKWRIDEGVDDILARAQTFRTEATSGKLFVRGTCLRKRPLIWVHLGRENNALDPEANVSFLIYTVVRECMVCSTRSQILVINVEIASRRLVGLI